MKILSRNVAGLNSAAKRHQVINHCRGFDIALLQETKLTTASTAFIRAKWGSPYVYLSTTGRASRGVITLLHSRVAPTILREENDPNGQFHIILATIKETNWLIVNTYGSPEADTPSYDTMLNITRKMEDIQSQHPIDSVVMGGDFNMVLEDRDTTSGTRKPRTEGQLLTILNTFNLYDIAGLQSRFPRHTYFRHRNEHISARHDRFYISQNLVEGTKFKILPRTGDHAPIEISSQDQNMGARWKFTDTLLTNPEFIQRLHDNIKESLAHYTDGHDDRLSEMQNNIDFSAHSATEIFCKTIENVRKFCMAETKSLRTKRREEEKEALTKFAAARDALNSDPNNEQLIQEYETEQENLRLTQSRRHQKALELNYNNFATLSERTTRYHFSRAMRGRASREIPKLIITENGDQRVIEGPEIQNFMYSKYEKLTQVDPEACQSTIEQFLGQELTATVRTCPQDQHNFLTSPVMTAEIKNIMKDLKLNSAPGPMGLSNSLMKEITPFMHKILVEFGNNMLFGDNPDFPPWLFHRIVIFILKPGKSSTDPEAFRGLSMLEGFFKIYSKILANRMQRSMRHIQQPHQFGFTRGRGILEASRTVLDVSQHAKKHNRPLILISTDFYKAFDSVSIQHLENCLQFYQFPQQFIQAFMRLARNGTVQFEVNSQLSGDYKVQKGTGQGDPKSSFGYNISAAPLNHYLANSTEVPRYKIQEQDISPVFFADDAMLLLNGDRIDEIILMLQKISEYYKVSGLKLNLSKCEILPINCNEEQINRLIQTTGMKQVTVLKHLGIHIDSDGTLPHDKNIAPLIAIMNKTADSFNSNLSTPLGRAIYSKFLLCSKYLHRIQNFHFTIPQLKEMRKAALRLTWTRARPNDDTSSVRVHIARRRVAQPLYYGGLSVPDPVIQSKSLSFSWARKFCTPNASLTWVWMLNDNLANLHRPNIHQHTTLGPREWTITSVKLETISSFWSGVFATVGKIIQLSHTHDKEWAFIPILGNEFTPNNRDISSIQYENPAARNLYLAGCQVVGQLFHLNNLGRINPNRTKTYEVLEAEFHTHIPIHLRNSLTMMIRNIKTKFRHNMQRTSQMFEKISTLQSLVRSKKTGCSPATRLILQDMRKNWEWGPTPRSFFTYQTDGLIDITATEFSKSILQTRSNILAPSVQWTSIQIFLRTLWTNVKESGTPRNLARNNPISPNCSNCGLLPEHTIHLMFECTLAQQIWNSVTNEFNAAVTEDQHDAQPVTLTRNTVLFNYIQSSLTPSHNKDLLHIVMTVKHRIYQFKYRENQERYPSLRLALLSIALDIDRVITIRQQNGLNSCFIEKFNNRIKAIVGLQY